eukprot:Nitzschia sp. Nitz4//scaffold60_size111251//33095//35408//NITZ4_004142-RA/size111251-augustus-gene-0.120-mRNA-1//-1//CDS//3329555549//5047//frame0
MDDLFGDDAWGEEPDWARLEDAGETSEATDETDVLVGAQHVVLLIDCHKGMFEANEDGSRPIDLALHLAQQLLQRTIRDTVTLKVGKRNGVGLCLYHTKPLGREQPLHSNHSGDAALETAGSFDSDDENTRDVHVLLPIQPPGVSQVQLIRDCVKGTRDLEKEFASRAEHHHETSTAPLQTALEEAMQLFRQSSCVRQPKNTASANNREPVDSRSIWILTNRSNPYEETSQRFLETIAQDAKESGIELVVWPLPDATQESDHFDMGQLYNGIVSYDVFQGQRIATTEGMDDGLDDLQQQWKKVRRLYWGPLVLPDWRDQDSDMPSIMVDWYRFIQMAKKPGRVQIDQRTKRETVLVKMYMDRIGEIFATFRNGDPADRLKPKPGLQRIRTFATFGGESIQMTSQDLKDIRYLANGSRDKASLTLLGFKPRDSIPFWHSLDTPYLIYPNEALVEGSRDAFVELHTAMIEKDVVAIGEVLHRTHWSSRLVMISPLEETFDEDHPDQQKRPPGMLVTTLPFQDDIRELENDESIERLRQSRVKKDEPDLVLSDVDPLSALVTEELLEATSNLVARQRLAGVELGEDFENAALSDFYNYLERVALAIPVPEENDEYDTRPAEADILKHVGEQIEAFRQALPEDIVPEKATSSRKRKKELPSDDSGLDWVDLHSSGELQSLKVPQLKEYLRSVGAPLSGSKAILVERVSKLIAESMASAGNVKKE